MRKRTEALRHLVTAAARRVVEAATTSRRCWTLVASEQSPPNGGGSSHPGWPGKCPRGVRPAGCPGRAVLAPPLASPRSPGAESHRRRGRAGGASVLVCVPLSRVCTRSVVGSVFLGAWVCVCVCVCDVCQFFCVPTLGGSMSVYLPACVCLYLLCVFLCAVWL